MPVCYAAIDFALVWWKSLDVLNTLLDFHKNMKFWFHLQLSHSLWTVSAFLWPNMLCALDWASGFVCFFGGVGWGSLSLDLLVFSFSKFWGITCWNTQHEHISLMEKEEDWRWCKLKGKKWQLRLWVNFSHIVSMLSFLWVSSSGGGGFFAGEICILLQHFGLLIEESSRKQDIFLSAAFLTGQHHDSNCIQGVLQLMYLMAHVLPFFLLKVISSDGGGFFKRKKSIAYFCFFCSLNFLDVSDFFFASGWFRFCWQEILFLGFLLDFWKREHIFDGTLSCLKMFDRLFTHCLDVFLPESYQFL